MLFSNRNKFKAARDSIQIEFIDEQARNRIWSLYTEMVFSKFDSQSLFLYERNRVRGSNFEPLIIMIWQEFFKEPTDTIPNDINDALNKVRKVHFGGEWFDVFDVLEIIIKTLPYNVSQSSFIDEANKVFEIECVGYRIVNEEVVKITDETELSEIDSAINNSPSPIKIHLETALQLLSDRKSPDYRNSIKESISAVESTVKIIGKSEKETLGSALKKLNLHKGFKKGISDLYGYTSEDNGIRHALMEEPNLTFADAKFFMVLCSSFINYLFEKTH